MHLDATKLDIYRILIDMQLTRELTCKEKKSYENKYNDKEIGSYNPTHLTRKFYPRNFFVWCAGSQRQAIWKKKDMHKEKRQENKINMKEWQKRNL